MKEEDGLYLCNLKQLNCFGCNEQVGVCLVEGKAQPFQFFNFMGEGLLEAENLLFTEVFREEKPEEVEQLCKIKKCLDLIENH